MHSLQSFAIVSMLLLLSCVRHSVESIQLKNSIITKANCDSTNISFSGSIKRILKDSCYSCHSTAITSSSGGLDLENYHSLKNYLNYFYHNDSIYGSKFLHIIHHNGLVIDMPPTSILTDCELAQLDSWIRQGAPNN